MEDSDLVSNLIDKTSFLEVSDEETNLENTIVNTTHFPIIAKILYDKPLNNNAIKSTLIKAWGLHPKIHTNVVDQNTVVFLLENENDRRRIWNLSPWSFLGNLIVSKPWLPEEALEDVDLSKIQIWVQATGVPVRFVNKATAEKIGNTVGKFIGTDLATEGHKWRKSLRIRVEVEIKEPLKDHVVIKCQENKSFVLEIRYERLGDFCHVCGILGHKISSCCNKPPHEQPDFFQIWSLAEN
ncbi:UNVERIFIED_CONTAM: hypothetical protein Slati_4280200 [Sesamum latifolium]|uniref:DUF4283 domain-containing protein n=1 Tax=Sesamum latifolium TaxID=2727402 RepID=A0AAW2TD70_9LAMI